MLTGLGLAVITREKLDELTTELIEKGEITGKKGKKPVDELLKKSETARKDLENWLEKNGCKGHVKNESGRQRRYFKA